MKVASNELVLFGYLLMYLFVCNNIFPTVSSHVIGDVWRGGL